MKHYIILGLLALGSLAWGQSGNVFLAAKSGSPRPSGGSCTTSSDGKLEVCYYRGDLNKYAEDGLPTGADYCGATRPEGTFFCFYPIETPKQEVVPSWDENNRDSTCPAFKHDPNAIWTLTLNRDIEITESITTSLPGYAEFNGNCRKITNKSAGTSSLDLGSNFIYYANFWLMDVGIGRGFGGFVPADPDWTSWYPIKSKKVPAGKQVDVRKIDAP